MGAKVGLRYSIAVSRNALTLTLGTITPVAPGRMRNAWYPRQQAEYLSTFSDIKARDVVPERDFTFGMSSAKDNTESLTPEKVDNGNAMPRIKLLPVSMIK